MSSTFSMEQERGGTSAGNLAMENVQRWPFRSTAWMNMLTTMKICAFLWIILLIDQICTNAEVLQTWKEPNDSYRSRSVSDHALAGTVQSVAVLLCIDTDRLGFLLNQRSYSFRNDSLGLHHIWSCSGSSFDVYFRKISIVNCQSLASDYHQRPVIKYSCTKM